jgi:hypothetical protein
MVAKATLIINQQHFEIDIEYNIRGTFSSLSKDSLTVQVAPVLEYKPTPLPDITNLFLVSYKRGKYYKLFSSDKPLELLSQLQEGNRHTLELLACCANNSIPFFVNI